MRFYDSTIYARVYIIIVTMMLMIITVMMTMTRRKMIMTVMMRNLSFSAFHIQSFSKRLSR